MVYYKHKGKRYPQAELWPGVATELLERVQDLDRRPASRDARTDDAKRDLPRTARGRGLNARARAVRVGGRTLVDLGSWPIGRVARFFDALAGPAAADLGPEDAATPLDPVVANDRRRTTQGDPRPARVPDQRRGSNTSSLDRSAPTLSGGEAQRIRLASQVGAGLVGVLYILDEPSIGLHPRDNDRLIATLQRLRDVGNTVIVVEHDEDTMRAADHLVDLRSRAGREGGAR